MKTDPQLISYLKSLTVDEQQSPRQDNEACIMSMRTIRKIISLLEFNNREPYKEKEIHG